MRKKLALFSSLLALPAVFAQQHDLSRFHEGMRSIFELIPLDIANTMLAFITATSIIYGALSMTKLGGGEDKEPMKGAGAIAGALGGTFGIFVYFTKFDFITFVMPFILLLIVIVLFALSMVWLMPPNDPRAADRQRGIALLVAGVLLVSLNSTVVKFQEYLESFAAQTGGDISGGATADILFMIGPFTTLIGLVLIIWGAVKINNALRDTGANRAGGFMHDLWSRVTGGDPEPAAPPGGSAPPAAPGGAGLTGNLVVHEVDNTGPVIPPAGTTLAGDVFFDASTTTGGTAPYTFAWTFSTPPAAAPGDVATFTADYSGIGAITPITVDLTVTDSTGATDTVSYNFEVHPFWPFRRGQAPRTERGAPSTTGATPAPTPTENPNPVKNTETGDYMLTFLDPATKHRQFTLELSLSKADGSPVIGPLTQNNGIFNLGKLEDGEYQWALSRVNTVKNKKTSTRNGKFTISDALPPVVNPPEGTEPGTTALTDVETNFPAELESTVASEIRDFETEHKALREKLRMMDLEAEDQGKDLTNLIVAPVDEENKDIRRNSLIKEIKETTDALEQEIQVVSSMMNENMGQQMLEFQQQISQLSEMTKDELDKKMPLNQNEQTSKVRSKHGEELGNIWDRYRTSITGWRKTQRDINSQVKALQSKVSQFEEKEISAHQANLTQLDTDLKEYNDTLNTIASELSNAQDLKQIKQLQIGIGQAMEKHKKRKNLKDLQKFEDKLGTIAQALTDLTAEKHKLIQQQEQQHADQIAHLQEFHDKRAEVPHPSTANPDELLETLQEE